MKENNLKKEFDKKTVQRMRNIITGNAGDRTQTLSGWEKKQEDHKEGDVWEEDGRTWTIKFGIKQNLTKMDSLKKLVIMPLCCPNCNKPMKVTSINKKMYGIHGTCFDCVLIKEDKIKLDGRWEEYEKGQVKANVVAGLEDFEKALDSWYQEKESFISEAGDVESWEGGNKKAIYDEIKDRVTKAKESNIY